MRSYLTPRPAWGYLGTSAEANPHAGSFRVGRQVSRMSGSPGCRSCQPCVRTNEPPKTALLGISLILRHLP